MKQKTRLSDNESKIRCPDNVRMVQTSRQTAIYYICRQRDGYGDRHPPRQANIYLDSLIDP